MVAAVVVPITQVQHQLEQILVAQAVTAICLMAVQVHLAYKMQVVEQVAVAVAIAEQVLLVQETTAVMVEMVVAVVEPQTIQEQAALVVLAFFIYITKEIKWQRSQ